MTKTRIVLADDHPIVLDGLRNLVQAEADFELVGEASSGLAAIKTIREQKPDVAVLDISMPELNGIMLCRRLMGEMPELKVMILTLHEDRAFVNQALEAGARGYILKRSAVENLVHGVRALAAGGTYLDPAVAGRLLEGKRANAKPTSNRRAAPALTERETEVLKMAALGFTNKEIASRLDVGVKSVETYKARGLEKVGLKTRAELVRYASAEGWLEL
ncbi:MAG TPA: response regulator transcription factor [Xanthobacteraceae bacterium]|jgi:DNA-binding NarL/FixJ family response regulator|nr:response regulator transcription factor [Xanthobacteraceae bacterium]